jgi:hypothetical protein
MEQNLELIREMLRVPGMASEGWTTHEGARTPGIAHHHTACPAGTMAKLEGVVKTPFRWAGDLQDWIIVSKP